MEQAILINTLDPAIPVCRTAGTTRPAGLSRESWVHVTGNRLPATQTHDSTLPLARITH
jgi:hypothetical protein